MLRFGVVVVWCAVMVMWCGFLWCGVWCDVVCYGVVLCGGGVVRWCGIVVWNCGGVVLCFGGGSRLCCGVVWCGMVWCGVVWCDPGGGARGAAVHPLTQEPHT